MDFVWITDSHFMSASSVRTGDVLEDSISKLKWVVDYCISHNAVLLHSGDLFDKPSVPDMVKSPVIAELKRLPNPCIAVSGNHDDLYGSAEYAYKTSFNVLETSGVIHNLNGDVLDLGDVIISNQLPIADRGKPQIVLYHGFLNTQDKLNVSFGDIQNKNDQVYLLLGHDHAEYEPVVFNTTKIFRTGSFLRVSREESSLRVPKILHIKLIDGVLKSKLVPIDVARPAEEVFRTKLFSISKAKQSITYESIINQIKQVNQNKLTLKDAVLQVSTEDVYNYIHNLLEENKLNCQTNNKNL